jgi:hypothetical protein
MLDPKVQELVIQLTKALSYPPLPMEPPKIEATMLISKDIEKLSEKESKEAAKDVSNKPKGSNKDDYFEHLEQGFNLNIEKVAFNKEV